MRFVDQCLRRFAIDTGHADVKTGAQRQAVALAERQTSFSVARLFFTCEWKNAPAQP